MNPYLAKIRQEASDAFGVHAAQHGRDWGADGEWAFLREAEVRRALSAADPAVAKQLALHPQAVMSSYAPTGRATKWTDPNWRSVLIFTEHGIGDPYEYAHVHAAFDQAIRSLDRLDPDGSWAWDSINPAVHIFRFTGQPNKNPSTLTGSSWGSARDKLRSAAAQTKRNPQSKCDHNKLKADPKLWKALPYVGHQHTPEDETGPAETIELRNCETCGSTLAIVVPTENPGRRRLRRNPSPDVKASAVERYVQFHRYEPTKITEFGKGFEIPHEMLIGGQAKYTTYRSGKVDPSTLRKPSHPVDYIHEHDAGVRVYLAMDHDFEDDLLEDVDATEISTIEVPSEFRDVQALVKLGDNLGFAFKLGSDLVEVEGSKPLPELYCTPDGRCLLVIQDRDTVLAMLWGGALGVFARGIDG